MTIGIENEHACNIATGEETGNCWRRWTIPHSKWSAIPPMPGGGP